MDIINIYRLPHPTTTEETFPSSQGTFINIVHFLDHKTHLNKFERIEIIQCLLSDNNGITLEIRNKKITENFHTLRY